MTSRPAPAPKRRSPRFALASVRWGQLAENLKADSARRPWFVFARQRLRELEPRKQIPKDAKARAELIDERMKQPRETIKDKAVFEADRRRARNLFRDVRDLYAGETGDIGPLVEEARKLIEQYPPS